MNAFKRSPFIQIVIVFILGILIQNELKLNWNSIFVSLTLCTGTIVLYKSVPLKYKYFFEKYLGMVYMLLIFLAGAVVHKYHLSSQPEIANNKRLYHGLIIDIPEETEKSMGATIKLKGFKKDSNLIKQNAKILSYFEKDSTSSKLQPGDEILFYTRINPVKNFGNPNEFDYKQYLTTHSIYYNTYIPKDKWKRTEHKSISSIIAFSNQVRLTLLNKLKTHLINKDEYAVASALLLGFKGFLTPDLKQKFSSSGAMHILAVSGLHVGIIYFFFHYLLLFMERHPKSKFIKTVIILVILCGYAFLTGLSPSVSRATLMFSVLATGNLLGKNSSVYNSLAFSAFVLLFINPMLLFSVGFQLSYLAVLSIVFFQPRLYNLLSLPAVPDKLWQWFTVAVAAQIGTAPLTIHYFNQFSNYFWLTNFFAIPAATLIIILGVLFFMIYPLSGYIGQILVWLLNFVLTYLNKLIDGVDSMPLSIVPDLWLDQGQIFTLYGMILMTSLLIIKKSAKQIILILSMILLLIVWDINKTINLRSKEEFVVFNIPGKAVYNYVSDSENIVITGDSIKKNEEDVLNEIRYYTENFWLKNKITGTKVFRINNIQSKLNQHTNAFYFKNNYMNLGGIKLYRPDKQPFKNLIPHKKLQLDYILISKDSDISVEKLSSCFEFKKVIIDSSIPYYKRIKWKKRFRENNIKYYDVNEKGAFKLEFDQKKVEKI